MNAWEVLAYALVAAFALFVLVLAWRTRRRTGLPIATGDDLDRLAWVYGIRREPGETCAKLRSRLNDHLYWTGRRPP